MRPRSVVGMRTTPSADTNNCSVGYRKVKIEKSGEEFNNIEIRVSDTVLYLYFLLIIFIIVYCFYYYQTVRPRQIYVQSNPDGKAFPGSENVDKIKLANFRCKNIVKHFVGKS